MSADTWTHIVWLIWGAVGWALFVVMARRSHRFRTELARRRRVLDVRGIPSEWGDARFWVGRMSQPADGEEKE